MQLQADYTKGEITISFETAPTITDAGNYSLSTRGNKDAGEWTVGATIYKPASAAMVLDTLGAVQIRERFADIRTKAQDAKRDGKRGKAASVPGCWRVAYAVVTGAEADPRDPEGCQDSETPFVDANTRAQLAERFNIAPAPSNGQAGGRMAELLAD